MAILNEYKCKSCGYKIAAMKSLLSVVFLLCSIITISAQSETQGTTKEVDYIMYYLDIDKNLPIKDKIIVRNITNYYIGMVSVAVCEKEQFIPLGTCLELVPGNNYVVVSYNKNELKKLRKKRIAIKMKGIRSESELLHFNPKDIKIKACANRHDLIIDIYNTLTF